MSKTDHRLNKYLFPIQSRATFPCSMNTFTYLSQNRSHGESVYAVTLLASEVAEHVTAKMRRKKLVSVSV